MSESAPPPIETPPARPEFDLDRTLETAMKEMLAANEAVSRAAAGQGLEAFEKARVEFDEKNAAYERALAAKGFRPPWPPKTPEGMAVWDVTPEDIAKWESSRR